ncbi:MAG: hypothetical protein CM15mP84_02030 [Cellvibrionales bacterium]|nr:MAG: hypothetical protein CM15mP84_02030 [Cellvibrionales bacterium]
MGLVFSARGIIAEGASSWFLPRLVGMSKALEWAMSARIFRSEEALEAGLIRSIHELDDLLPAAYKLAREFASNSRVSNAVIRQMFWRCRAPKILLSLIVSTLKAWCSAALPPTRLRAPPLFSKSALQSFPIRLVKTCPTSSHGGKSQNSWSKHENKNY